VLLFFTKALARSLPVSSGGRRVGMAVVGKKKELYCQTFEVSFYSTCDEEIMSRFVVVNTKWSCELFAKTVYEIRNALFDGYKLTGQKARTSNSG
jgi:hypothetical protein